MINVIFNSLLKLFVKLTLKIYFRKWEIHGLENIPKGVPVILAANHQNAFLDALVLTTSSNRLPYYLARAEVFNNPLAAKALRFIRLMPIYRFRDGLANVKRNDEIIESCREILSKGEALVMFPEGNHSERWNLRPLQRGLSRIAFKTEALTNFSLGSVIVPVGIQYESPKSFRSRLLVQFGEPIAMANYRKDWDNNERTALDVLKEDLFKSMRPLILNIPDENYEHCEVKFKEKRVFRKSLTEQFSYDQELVDAITEGKEINQQSESKSPPIIAWLFAVPSWIINVIPYRITQWFIKRFVSDPVFTSSVKYAAGITLVPIWYLIVVLNVWIISPNPEVVLGTALALPFLTVLGLEALRKIYR